ncbi:MAG: 1-hydroxycarotenoid 3,4-desaturase CrtD [Bacteroidales bacterium]
MKKAAIIGSGIAGIGSALRLAAKGYEVTVYEQAAIPGGKISQIRDRGFRFDTGPSLFTLPNQVDELFQLFGEKPEDHFRYNKLDTSCKYFWDDGTIVNAWQETESFAREIEEVTGVSQKSIHGFFKKSSKLYDVTADIFMFNSLHKFKNFTTPNFRKSLLQVHELDAFTSMHKKNTQWFSHPRIVQLFDRYATYNGSDPYQTPATLNIIAHLEHNIGAFFPESGMYSIIESLAKLAERKGVKFLYNTPVQEIIIEEKRIKAIRANDKIEKYDLVVSDVDVDTLYRKLMPADHKPPRSPLKTQRSTSALIFYWGVDKTFPELDVHNILFSDDYRKEFSHLFESRTISPDPTVYLFISSKVVEGDAPEGSENWYVMINVPENVGQNWDSMIADARRNIINRINHVLNVDIEKHIQFEHMTDPRTIEEKTGSFRGSLYGPSSNSRFAAFLRHPNFRRKYKNLFFTGGSVHPGGGIPLCLASAKIVGQEIPEV